MKIVIVNGFPLVGKDLFCGCCLNYMTIKGIMGGQISTIDFIKEIAKQVGWNGLKEPKDRKFLSDLKDLLTEYNNSPFIVVTNQIRETFLRFKSQGIPEDRIVFFVHCREPKEIQKFVDEFGATTLLIRRKEVEELPQSNHADSEVFNFDYDEEIDNNGTIEELDEKARNFIDKLVKF